MGGKLIKIRRRDKGKKNGDKRDEKKWRDEMRDKKRWGDET